MAEKLIIGDLTRLTPEEAEMALDCISSSKDTSEWGEGLNALHQELGYWLNMRGMSAVDACQLAIVSQFGGFQTYFPKIRTLLMSQPLIGSRKPYKAGAARQSIFQTQLIDLATIRAKLQGMREEIARKEEALQHLQTHHGIISRRLDKQQAGLANG